MAKKQKKTTLYYKISRRVYGLFLILTCIVFWLSLCCYSKTDSSFNYAGANVTNMLGQFGANSSDFLLTLFGVAVSVYLLVVCSWGAFLCMLNPLKNMWLRFFAWLLGMAFSSVFLNYFAAGGVAGKFLSRYLTLYIPSFPYVAELVAAVAAVLGFCLLNYAAGVGLVLWLTGFVNLLYFMLRCVVVFFVCIKTAFKKLCSIKFAPAPKQEKKEPVFALADIERNEDNIVQVIKEPKIKTTIEEKTKIAGKSIKNNKKQNGTSGYVCPSVELLSKPSNNNLGKVSDKELEITAKKLETVLQEFGVNGKIVKIRPGPVVTLYELEPAPGTKTARVIGLSDDIARSMSAVSVRIAVVSGKNTIGIELPNTSREIVWLRDLFEGDGFKNTKNALNVVLGKDIGGENVYADLSKMPHLLVAGTTGSGKSVGMNSMILSLLYRMSPSECKLIMIDPKMLEFSVYNGIPHLLTPVITDPAKAVLGLKWAVAQMEDRYRAMAQLNVRNIAGYNKRLEELRNSSEKPVRTVQTGFDMETGAPLYEQQEIDLTPLPYIVIVVDEMADLMLVAGKEVEAAIQRLAQMARAAGSHLILSTQRPSVDVITGVIKANFPTRISFQVTSKIDSRTILGEQGAEQLLGMGDMLYMPAGQRPIRVHGSVVKDSEVESIVEYLKSQCKPEYVEGITEGELNTKDSGAVFDKTSMGNAAGSDEDLYSQAVEIVRNDKKTSISYVQRRLRIGYNRAALLIERMEEDGIISAPDHTGKRMII